MSQTKTTLSQALTASANLMIVAAATGAEVGGYAKIEDELAQVASINGLNVGLKHRGCEGTLAAAHAANCPVVFCAAEDLPGSGPRQTPNNLPTRDIKSYSASGAIALPNGRDMIACIGIGATSPVHAMTVADPPKNAHGALLHIVNMSAAANTVTLTTGYGGSNATDVFTFSGAIGDTITLLSLNGTWSHVATGLVAADTVSATVA